jgi:hypothetical protein
MTSFSHRSPRAAVRPGLGLRLGLLLGVAALQAVPAATPAAPAASAEEQPFRPEAGRFPPLEKSHGYRGELAFVDHANRRGSIRIPGTGEFYRNPPQPFAMLPYGVVRYHGGPADLRDIPIGTVLHVRAFLPPDPTTSCVPVLPVAQRTRTDGIASSPAENHVLLLEDEPSHCQREGLVWKLEEVEVKNHAGSIVAVREPKQGGVGDAAKETMTFDAATRIWRGRECLTVADLVAEGGWPAEGKKPLGGQPVQLGITWKPTTAAVFKRFHVSDIWLDDAAMQRAAGSQTETHKAFIRSRWMPGWVDAVEYGTFGRATVTATLFGGMDPSLYDDFQKGVQATMNGAENTLRHTGGSYGPAHMASHGRILDVTKASGDIPLGSSGIQIRFETDLIVEGIRPGRVVRMRPAGWTLVNVPREEYVSHDNEPEHRFPTPAIFPKY